MVTSLSRRQFVVSALGATLLRGQAVTSLKKFGNRHEGLGYIATGAAPSVEIIGFHGHYSGFSGQQELFVKYFSPSEAEVTVRAREIEIVRQYWMESFPQKASKEIWGTFGPWPTADLLTPEQIPPDNLAVIAYQGRLVLPTFVYSWPQTLPAEIVSYVLFVQSDKSASRLLARISNAAGLVVWSKPIEAPVVAGVPFRLAVDIGSKKDGDYLLTFVGWKDASGPSNPTVFYHRSKLT